MSGGVRVWFNLQFGTIYSNHDYFYSMQLIFYYIRRKKNEFQCSSIGVGNWSLIKNIFLVFSSSSSIFFQKISSNRRTHYGNTGYGVSKSGDTAKSKLERRQFSTSTSFVKIWSPCSCEFKAYFVNFLGSITLAFWSRNY